MRLAVMMFTAYTEVLSGLSDAIVRRAEAWRGGAGEVGQVVEASWPSSVGAAGVGGDWIGADDQRVGRLEVGQRTARRPVGHHARRAIEHDEGRLHQRGQLDDDAVDILVELVAAAAEQPVPVLHRHRRPGAVVMLDRRDADELGDAAQRLEQDGPVADQPAAGQRSRPEKAVPRQDRTPRPPRAPRARCRSARSSSPDH